MTTTARQRLLAAAAATTLTLTLAACSGGEPSGDASTAPGGQTASTETQSAAHNAADTEFAQMMIVHHWGAIEMARLAVSQGTHPEVKALGERISAAQGPEIEEMTGWLEAWGEPAPDEMDHGDMDMGSMDMDGMDQAGAMAELKSLSGTEFDKRFLELMIAHHQGAIEMSEQELAEGENPEALALARTIIDAQQAEITEMTNLSSDL